MNDQKRGISVLVCGGRGYRDDAQVRDTLDLLHATRTIRIVITGAASGADELAEDWARSREIDYIGFPAKWNTHGNTAGPIRNSAMLEYAPNLVVAFPGGRGTADMTRKARDAGIEVLEVK